MPIRGLLLGRSLSTTLGHAAHWIGAALLIVTGGYTAIQALRSPASHDGQAPATPAGQPTARLLVTGAALSIDTLTVGFALVTAHVSLAVAAIMIGAISVCMSLISLELGNRIGARGRRARRTPRRPGPDRCRRRRGLRHRLTPSRQPVPHDRQRRHPSDLHDPPGAGK